MKQLIRALAVFVIVLLWGCADGDSPRQNRSLAAVSGKVSLYASQLEMKKGAVSDTSLSSLSVRDQAASDDDYSRFLDFTPASTGLTAWLTFPVSPEVDPTASAELEVNYKGWHKAKQTWAFAVYEPKAARWVNLGNNGAAVEWTWSTLRFTLRAPLSTYIDNGKIRIRYSTSSRLENSYLDYVGLTAGSRTVPAAAQLFGLTLDSIEGLSSIEDSLSRLSRRPTARIVFDQGMPASYYQTAVSRLHGISGIMGELLDSFAMPSLSVAEYGERAQEYLTVLGTSVDIWEVGNEINGEWLGDTPQTVAKLSAAYDLVKGKNGKTAMTLYYNQDCYAEASHEMFRWAEDNVPARMRSGLDYVLVSYYEDDCNNAHPEWQPVFDRLGALFPNSKLGFGEVGTKYTDKKVEYLQRYYQLKISHPRFIGGYFWWYGKQDLVPYTSPYWAVFNELGLGF